MDDDEYKYGVEYNTSSLGFFFCLRRSFVLEENLHILHLFILASLISAMKNSMLVTLMAAE